MELNTLALLVLPVMRITKKTRNNYQGAYTRYLAPRLGDIEIEQLTSDDLLMH
jgi:hypothetical protein